MANVTDARYWLTTLLTLTLVATTLVGQKAEVDDPLVVRGTAHATASGATPLAIDRPEGTEPGDLLVAVVAINGPSANAPGDDWTLVRSDSRGGELTQALWMKEATEGEPGVHKWSGGNRRTFQVGTIIAVGSDDIGEVRLLDAGAAAHRLDPVVLSSLHAEEDGALLLGAFSLSGTEQLETSDDAMTTLDSIDGAITLTTAHQTVSAGDTGELVIKRATSGGAAGQLLLIERVPANNEPNEEPVSEEPVDEGSDAEDVEPVDEEVDDSEGGESGDPEAEPGSDDHEHDGHDQHDEHEHDGHDEHDEDDSHHLPDGGSDGDDHDKHDPRLWSDATTWPDGTIPSSHTDVVIDGHVVIDGNASALTVTVPRGSTLEFAADANAQLQAFGNVVVEGTLKMQPAGYDIEHALRFFGVDEDAFVGGGHDVLESDTGLWFTGHGHAALAGTDRLPWTRAARSLAAGSTVVELEDSPEGWQIGDEVVITPTSAPGTPGFSNGYSEGRIADIEGTKVTLGTPLAYDHPRVNDRWGAEVMNMTRNVRIEGTPNGRVHVMFSHVHGAQLLSNVSLRHMGPRQDTEDTYRSGRETVAMTEGVMGRYPLHFHHSFDGTVGSLVENVVVRESGFRAFVPHASNGITFRGTIAHDVFDEAYWWDRTEGGTCCGDNWEHAPQSDDIVYDHAVASLIKSDPPFRGYELTGFELGHGANTSVTNSVAVGVQGNKGASGFNWPGGVPHVPGHWLFENNVSHNNKVHGMRVWDNRGRDEHLIASSVTYHNGSAGVFHGAYRNDYQYRDIVAYGNGRSGFDQHAQGDISINRLQVDAAGISPYAYTTGRHRITHSGAQLFEPKLVGYTHRAIAFRTADVGSLDIVNPTFGGTRDTWFWLSDTVPTESVYRVQLANGEAFRLHPATAPIGELVPAWNARIEPITPFHR